MTRAALRPSARNVLRVYREATADELAAGREWYRRAQSLAAELDPDDPVRAAAVIAVLSPQTPWPRNVALARRAYALAESGATVDGIAAGLRTMQRSARKAAELLAGAEPDLVVSGPKVRAFWHAIADPTDARAVVIDRHAVDVAVGRITDDATRGALLRRAGAYAALADVYLRAARALQRAGDNVTAPEVQAVTWTVWRAHHALAHHRTAEEKENAS